MTSRVAHHMSLIVHVTTTNDDDPPRQSIALPRWLILGSRATCRIFKDLTLRLVKVAIKYAGSQRSLMMNQSNPHNDSQNTAGPLEREVWGFARVAWEDVIFVPHPPQSAFDAALILDGPLVGLRRRPYLGMRRSTDGSTLPASAIRSRGRDGHRCFAAAGSA